MPGIFFFSRMAGHQLFESKGALTNFNVGFRLDQSEIFTCRAIDYTLDCQINRVGRLIDISKKIAKNRQFLT